MKLVTLLFFTLLSLFGREPITPILPYKNLNSQKITLGKKLFFDTRLSKDNTIACATCHKLSEGGDDNLKFSFGINGQEGNINAPTVLNTAYSFRQFWDVVQKTYKTK